MMMYGGFAAQEGPVIGLIQARDVPELQPRVTKQSLIMQYSQSADSLIVNEFIGDFITIVGIYLYIHRSRCASCNINIIDHHLEFWLDCPL
jgi:hypothetical protein